ncbi:MAG TPA: PPC domain-containing protein [Gemmatales bacterium]|nr:PPC domain-containing protein [Gemmatales bacterium]
MVNTKRHISGTAVAWVVLLSCASLVVAQSVGLPSPRLLTTMPMGGKVGTELEVTITGEHLEEVGDLIFSDPRITAERKLDAAGAPIANMYVVTIGSDCPVGLYEARVMTRLGISSSRIFAVGTLNEIVQIKPNRTLAAAPELPLNCVCNGVTADRSIDFYKFHARKGQRLVIDCATVGIDSKLNATVILGDEAGRDLLVERRAGVIDFSVPKDGTYVIKVHELTFKGGPAFYYRLGLWEQPAGTPIIRQPSTKPVHSFSWPPQGLPIQAAQKEVEPNNDGGHAQRITLPCDIAGRFYPAADVDVFEFNAKKGEEWWIEVASERLGLRTDPSLVVQQVVKGEKGSPDKLIDVLELSDIPSPMKVSSNGYAYDGPPYNAGTSDILGKLTIKEDGLYRMQLTDLFGGTRSDPGNNYRLVIRRAAPDFALVAWALHMELRNGDRNALSKPISLRGGTTMALEVVAFRRDGFDGEIELAMEGLPKGVTAQGLKIPAGQSRGMMLITAQADAPRGYANATFVGRSTIAGKSVTRPCRLASVAWPIPDSWGEIPSPRLLADVPVSVSGSDRAPLTIAAKTPVVEAKAGEKLTIPLIHKRTSDFSGDTIQMRVIGTGFEKAPGFDLPIKANSSQVVLDLKTLKIPPGEYHVSFLGGGVAKYRHRPELVATVEADSQKKQLEVKTLETELKKVSTEAQNAPPPKKEQMTKTLASMNARMKAASDALNATKQQLNQVKAAAEPRDIVDIVVCEPITIRVKPVEKK